MSYILDALKKIEHEKNKKARSDGRISISGDLFQERKRPATRTGIWKIMLLIVVASLLTFTGTWFLLQGNAKKNGAASGPTVVVLPAAVVPPPAMQTAPPAPLPLQPAPVVALAPAVTPAADHAVPKREEVVADDESSARSTRSTRSPQKEIKVQSLSTIQPVQTVQVPAGIMLSGIAWQESRAARRAVINGFLLKEGAVVAGAKITGIQADRVRFLSSDGTFEIKLDSVVPAEVK